MTTIIIDRGARGVVTLTLARPEKGNALNAPMLAELASTLDALSADVEARIVVLRAQGKHFCTGAELGEARGGGGPSMHDVLQRIDRLPKPTIAIVHGGCVGAGIGLVACCDVVIARQDAFFSVPELRVGRAPSPAFTALLTRALTARALRRYGLSGERISADTALGLGLVHQICAEDGDATLDGIVEGLLHAAPAALALFKGRMRAAQSSTPDATAVLSHDENPERPAEALEGVAAFREKRKPAWYPPKDDRSTRA